MLMVQSNGNRPPKIHMRSKRNNIRNRRNHKRKRTMATKKKTQNRWNTMRNKDKILITDLVISYLTAGVVSGIMISGGHNEKFFWFGLIAIGNCLAVLALAKWVTQKDNENTKPVTN